MSEVFTVETLDRALSERLAGGGAPSYTRTLAERGPAKCAEKFGEEAVEAIVAAATGDRDALTREAADVVYHLLVLLKVSDVAWSDVTAELSRRTARSGLDEKHSREPRAGTKRD